MNPASRQLRSSQRASTRGIVVGSQDTIDEVPTQPVRSRKRGAPAEQQTPRPTRQVAAKKAAGRGAPQPPIEEEEEEEDTVDDARNKQRPFIQQAQQFIERAKDQSNGFKILQECLNKARGVGQEENGSEGNESEGNKSDGRESIEWSESEGDASGQEKLPPLHLALTRKKRKQRIMWTEAEEKFLAGLITKRGAKWSKFEKEYGNSELHGRSQMAMKDKARNLMRLVVDGGQEKEFLRKYPKWAGVTVGRARRGVHAYEGDKIPVSDQKDQALEKLKGYARNA